MQTTQELPSNRFSDAKSIQELAIHQFQKPKSQKIIPFNAKYFCEFATAYMRNASPNKSQEFVLDKTNEKVVKLLWDYFFNPVKFDKDYQQYSSAKGILLFGAPGSGKTELLYIFNALCQAHKLFHYKNRGKVMYGFGSTSFWDLLKMHEDNKQPIIDNSSHWFYDELGLDACRAYKSYGNSVDIDTRVLQLRYKVFRSGTITHFTTNLNLEMFENEETGYDQRTRSRLKEMCNFIPFTGNDRRALVKLQRKELAEESNQLTTEQIEANREIFLNEIKKAKETKEYPPFEFRIVIWYDLAIKEKLFELSVEQRWEEMLLARQEIFDRYNTAKAQLLLKHKRKEWTAFQNQIEDKKVIQKNVFENESISRAKVNSIIKYYLEA
ncbi:hypothetical protein WAF17_16635 [Bernardetia sp. ABR2-2B]|uniref:hypothetical protein n=1 Tax=Bernardetia sp. ABR2-2B TaxID=3127472 RepID=UPI0030D4F973